MNDTILPEKSMKYIHNFVRFKMAICLVGMSFLLPWCSNNLKKVQIECEGIASKNCTLKRNFIMFMFSPLMIYFGILFIIAITTNCAILTYIRNPERV